MPLVHRHRPDHRATSARWGARDVRTIIDLRAERDLDIPQGLPAELDVERVRLPVRDGQAPPPGVVREVLRVVEEADGTVFLHCGAGVGRTGSIVAAYRVFELDRPGPP